MDFDNENLEEWFKEEWTEEGFKEAGNFLIELITEAIPFVELKENQEKCIITKNIKLI